MSDKTNINIRDIDRGLYLEFKSAIYAQGFKSIKQAVTTMMQATVAASKKSQ